MESGQVETVEVLAAEDVPAISMRSPILNIWFKPRETMIALMARARVGQWNDPYRLQHLFFFLSSPIWIFVPLMARDRAGEWVWDTPHWEGITRAFLYTLIATCGYLANLLVYTAVTAFFVSFIYKGFNGKSLSGTMAALLWGHLPIMGFLFTNALVALIIDPYGNAKSEFRLGEQYFTSTPPFILDGWSQIYLHGNVFGMLLLLFFGGWSLYLTSILLATLYSRSVLYGIVVLLIGGGLPRLLLLLGRFLSKNETFLSLVT